MQILPVVARLVEHLTYLTGFLGFIMSKTLRLLSLWSLCFTVLQRDIHIDSKKRKVQEAVRAKCRGIDETCQGYFRKATFELKVAE